MASGKEIVKIALAAAEEKKASNPVILDISGLTVIADYFLIVSGENERQVSAITDEIEGTLFKAGVSPKSVEGKRNDQWVLLDYGDAVIHVFHKDSRSFYDLERIWRDAKRIDKEAL